MLGKIIKGWFISIMGSPLALLAIAIGVVALVFMFSSPFHAIQNLFGIETKDSLKKELTIEKRNNEVLTDVGRQDKADIKILEKTEVNVQQTIEDRSKSIVETKKKAEKIQSTSEAKIEEIKKKDIPDEVKVQMVSEERMQSIWDTYCSFNESPECRVPVPTTQPDQGV